MHICKLPMRIQDMDCSRAHVYRGHPSQPTQTASNSVTFKCELCECSELSTVKDFFLHIGRHLKNNETVSCVFHSCPFKTNIYNTFYTHKKIKHHPYVLKDFKASIVTFVYPVPRSGSFDTGTTVDASNDDIDCYVPLLVLVVLCFLGLFCSISLSLCRSLQA